MKINNLFDFYFSSKIIFWILNFVFDILLVSFTSLFFKLDLTEIIIQLGILFPMTILSISVLGGYNKIKLRYLEGKKEKLKP